MADYITMKQIPGGVVTAKDDRIVYDANMADSGIIYGCGISYVGNNMIHIAAGYGIIKGGLFEMEDHTEYVDLAENEPTTGQIYLHLDLSADDKLTIVKETTNSLHPMVQNANANFTNGIYELQLCTFTATTTALEDVTQTFEVIQNQVLDTLPEIMANTTAGLKAGALALKEVSENLTANDGSSFRYAVVDGKDGRIRTVDGADTFFPFKSEPKPLSVETPNFTTASSFTQTINCEVGNILFVAVGLNANDSMSSIQMSVTGATAINDSYSSKAGYAGAIVGCIYKADATTVTISVSASGNSNRRYMPYICVCE